ncbi:MAG: glycosyltransferase [Arenicella sp.]|jgi:mannosyltransferase OCH1-like enzyme|nr:glycosyltransferase [Arenicella sp.]
MAIHAKPSTMLGMIKGVRYYSALESSGYGLAALSYILELLDQGVALEWRPFTSQPTGYLPWIKAENPKQSVRLLLEECITDRSDINRLLDCLTPLSEISHVILHWVPEYWPNLIEEKYFTIGYTVWETDQLPAHWAPIINKVDCVLVPCEFNRQTFLTSGVKIPIKVVPHILNKPQELKEDAQKQILKRLGSPICKNNFIFYSINEWASRKAMWTLLHCYLKVFRKGDAVTLIIKTSAMGPRHEADPQHHNTRALVAEICSEYQDKADVRVINEKLSLQEIDALHGLGDCFVSATHSEGWGLGSFEAAGRSNPVIITGWGGQLAYLDSDNVNLINYSLVPCEDARGVGSYGDTQRWAAVDEEHAAQLMMQVSKDPNKARDKAKKLATNLHQTYNSKTVGNQLIRAMRQDKIPKQFHFTFGLKKQTEPFHLAYYLCLKSCIAVNKPEVVHFHYHYEPYGEYWDLIKAELTLHKVELEVFIEQTEAYDAHPEGQFIKTRQLDYAHQSDFLRLKALTKYGGVYADMDTLFVNPIPNELYGEDFVIGDEEYADSEDTTLPAPSLCNALFMARSNSPFLKTWLEESYRAFDGTWSKHSCQLVTKLASDFADQLRVLPSNYFYKHGYSKKGIHALFEGVDYDFSDVYSMHMWNHLWWDKKRTDFSNFHGDLLNEKYILEVDTTYNIIARAYLTSISTEPVYSHSRSDLLLFPTINQDWVLQKEETGLSYMWNSITNLRAMNNVSANSIVKPLVELCDGKFSVAEVIDKLCVQMKSDLKALALETKVLLRDFAHQGVVKFEQQDEEANSQKV